MAKIEPFRGIRYNLRAVSDLREVLAPPYDVISPEYQDELYSRHNKNVVRLILNKIKDTDTETDNRYTRSASHMADWMSDGTLRRDDDPALYLYAQDYEVGGETKRRVGFICRRLVEPLGVSIYPHERTLSGPKTDRLNLTRACRMNFSQVFGLYSDPDQVLEAAWGEIMKSPPDAAVTDDDGVVHSMWLVTDEDIIAQAQDFLEDKPIVIADGHHRYETALNYRNERREKDGPGGDYDYVMMYLSNSMSEGFTVLPTHRLVKDIGDMDMEDVLSGLGESFDMIERSCGDKDSIASFIEELESYGDEGINFGFYAGGGRIRLITLKKDVNLRKIFPEVEPEELLKLDVFVLQELVFDRILGIDREQVAEKKTVSYTIDPVEAVTAVDRGAAKLAFLLNPTDMEKVVAVATAGGVMPQKSTYFYPKLISGLVFNPLG